MGEWTTANNLTYTINLQPNTIWTLSTINGKKGRHPQPPAPKPFPFPYADDFDSLPLHSQAPFFTDQSGSFEVVAAESAVGGNVLRQMMPRLPVSWCGETPLAYSLMGSHDWRDVNVTADVLIEANGTAFIAAAVLEGGCLGGRGSAGFTFAISSGGQWTLSNDTGLAYQLSTGTLSVTSGQWYRLSLVVTGDSVSAWVAGEELTAVTVSSGWGSGWAAIGSSYDYVQFDNFSVTKPSTAAITTPHIDERHIENRVQAE